MMTPLRIFFQLTVLLTTLPLQTFPGIAADSPSFAAEHFSSSPQPSVTLNELEHGISDRLKRVEEFKFIEQEAAKLGVRAWLFGGTAAGYAHYVKWDLQREQGDPRFQPDRFDYDYTNIYRSTQDLDIVIDGNAAQAESLQNLLTQKYPHVQGSKTAWEVRLLTQDMGDKQAILNNPDFLNQHTDSNSTGLIELTKPKNGESVVRDARDWSTREPHFLKDVHEGALHYYYSPLHDSTKFAKEGRNPPILSAIRFLTKAFQYELKIRPEDLAQIRKVIDEFNPKNANGNSYVSHWIEKNGKKLIQNAVNIEYAVNTLDQLGLRKKLAAIQNNSGTLDSLAWWMNKEPLRTQSLGQGNGRTAKELGLDVVAHETNTFLAYESITRAHTGDPNVLISRDHTSGEAAAYGEGFYTRIGKIGARGTGLTIRFHLNPDAREGTDFTRALDFVIVQNKAALQVIPESLNIDPVEYFRMLANDEMLRPEDRGVLEKIKRRIESKFRSLDETQKIEVTKIIQKFVDDSSPATVNKEALAWVDNPPILAEWFSFPFSVEHPEFVRRILDSEERSFLRGVVAKHALSRPHWKHHPEFVRVMMDKSPGLALHYILDQPHWQDHPEFVEELIMKKFEDEKTLRQLSMLFNLPHWKNNPRLRQLVNGEEPQLKNVLSVLMKKGPVEYFQILAQYDHFIDWDDRHLEMIKKHSFRSITSAQEKEISEIAKEMIQSERWGNRVLKDWFGLPIAARHPEIIDPVANLLKSIQENVQNQLQNPALRWTNTDSLKKWFSLPQSLEHPELLKSLIKMDGLELFIVDEVLSRPEWQDHPELLEALILKVFSHHQESHARLRIERHLLDLPHWKNNPALRRICNDQDPTYRELAHQFSRGVTVRAPSGNCVTRFLRKFLE